MLILYNINYKWTTDKQFILKMLIDKKKTSSSAITFSSCRQNRIFRSNIHNTRHIRVSFYLRPNITFCITYNSICSLPSRASNLKAIESFWRIKNKIVSFHHCHLTWIQLFWIVVVLIYTIWNRWTLNFALRCLNEAYLYWI